MGNLQSILDSGGGAALASANQSATTLVASIGFAFAEFGVQFLAFIILRLRLSRIYRPRSYLVPERQRVPLPPSGLFNWLVPVFKTPNLTLIQRCGLDAYFFLRFLRTLLKIFVPAGLLILPILLPINRYGGGGKEELNVLNISNISGDNKKTWYWAHLIMAIVFLLWTFYVIYEELRGYVRVRQAYLTSPQHRIRASATTVLVTGIPNKWLTLEALEGLYDVFPGGLRNIWINRNYDELSTKVDLRNKLAKQLENAETVLVKKCREKHKKAVKKGEAKTVEREMTPIRNTSTSSDDHLKGDSVSDSNGKVDAFDHDVSKEDLVKHNQDNAEQAADATSPKSAGTEHVSGSKIVETVQFWRQTKKATDDIEYASPIHDDYDQENDGDAMWRQYINHTDRETIRLPLINQSWFPSLPFMGKKVDRIYHLRKELSRLNNEIETDQKHPENFPLMNSAFIQFNHQIAAHMCCQSVNHHVPLQMAPRLVEISPGDVLWDNLSIKWWERYIRLFIVVVISVALIIFYAVPVSFSAALNNLGTIGVTYPSLRFLNDLSPAAKSIIQGIAPPIILQVVLILVPIIYGFLVKLQGVPTGNARELGVQNWYFAFLFIQVFLIGTLASGLLNFFAVLAQHPDQVAQTIGNSIPQAANYFLSYITVQALGNSASAILQLVTLLLWFLLSPLLDSTPRDKWKRQTKLSNVQWGTFFPPFTNFAVIGIIYSVIAPIIIPFVVLIFALFWIVYRYNVLYVYDLSHDTGGLLFPAAINQLFVGIYFLEICLIGLFFVAVAVPQGVIMVIILVFSVIYQLLLNFTFGPLFRYMPITLEDEAVERDEQFARMQASKFAGEKVDQTEEGKDIEQQLADDEKADRDADRLAEQKQQQDIEARRKSGVNSEHVAQDTWSSSDPTRSWKNDRLKRAGGAALKPVKGVLDLTGKAEKMVEGNLRDFNDKTGLKAANEKLGQNLRVVNEKTGINRANQEINTRIKGANDALNTSINNANGLALTSNDPEAQASAGEVLFSGLADELEDLTPEERDLLVRIAFQHSALRAKRPVVWIPQDELGVSDSEIKCAKKFSRHLPISNAGTRLDAKGKVVFEKSPPDFDNLDLIVL